MSMYRWSNQQFNYKNRNIMNEQLLLSNVRSSLVRQEETIIFALIERAQFLSNPAIYEPGHFGEVLEGESLVGFILLECERSHARVRRYTSPDEHPFYKNLPEPILPPLHYRDNPLNENTINVNTEIRNIYEEKIIPHICQKGDDKQYGASSVCDVAVLQALSKRIHYGKFVAESKYRANEKAFRKVISSGERDTLYNFITHEKIENRVLDRIAAKARTYTAEITEASTTPCLDPASIVDVYANWIIPMNKRVQVEYLLNR